jgi:hypothetical protein
VFSKAATVRHNRARGQHAVAGMADMVVSLSRRGKSDEWIGQELGMTTRCGREQRPVE